MVCMCQVEEVSEFSERSNSVEELCSWYSVPFAVADRQDSTISAGCWDLAIRDREMVLNSLVT